MKCIPLIRQLCADTFPARGKAYKDGIPDGNST